MKKTEMIFPLTVGFLCIVLVAIILFVLIPRVGTSTDTEIVELNNGYQLLRENTAWILNDQGNLIIDEDIVEFAQKGSLIFYKRTSASNIEVGCYDMNKRYLIASTTQSYEQLKTDLETEYKIKFLPVDEWFKKE